MNLVDSTSAALDLEAVLSALNLDRLKQMARLFGCELHEGDRAKDVTVRLLAPQLRGRMPALLREYGRDELRKVCTRHGLDARSPDRAVLQALILRAAGIDPSQGSTRPPAPVDDLPAPGQIVHARHRQWLVESVAEGAAGESPCVRLVCLDDDAPGQVLEVLWELELGARVIEPAVQGLGEVTRLDPPGHFGAYLHALKWSTVSAADAKRFQAPFRAGIKLMAHQLTPLMKALELPRANLFIADDVGLGKTIEAGLVLQELVLRQQADFVLIVAPASVCLQWQGEMQRRFGLRFEVMSRQFVMYRRQERGFGTNPWSTHNRFIVSHALLRRQEYLNPLLAHLGDRARKGLLILDEAHVAAPASGSKYAVDTDITATVRELAPRFDNRLFLSATPHNGHSNSFSALLEILEPARFTRGVPVTSVEELEPVMVRRLKRDLRQLGVEKFPRRLLVENALTHEAGRWSMTVRTYDAEAASSAASAAVTTVDLGAGDPAELELARLLAEYTKLCAPASGKARLPFISLQQRLLSSPEAFARTLEAHALGIEKRGGEPIPEAPKAAKASKTAKAGAAKTESGQLSFEEAPRETDPDAHGVDDDELADAQEAEMLAASANLTTPSERARELLREMRKGAERARRAPDAKMTAVLAWLRAHCCPGLGQANPDAAACRWTDRRVILFTEYADTKRYVLKLLQAAAEETHDGDARILQFHGGMGDEARAEVQAAFNAEPAEHPVRILVATDAAREGVNLQGFCADLIHLDIPWNPGRMEQRNGRIDRTLQAAEAVRCQYFLYPQRTEDLVLRTVVRKIATIQEELGSLGAVLLEDVERALEPGIDDRTAGRIERVGVGASHATVDAELESSRANLDALREEVEEAAKRMENSRAALEVRPEALRAVMDVGFALAGAAPLDTLGATKTGATTYRLPKLDGSWRRVLDTVRPPRKRKQEFREWIALPLKPVTFHPLASLTEEAEQLHLAHPIVRRVLDRFLAQGFGAHDLSRVAAVVTPESSVARVVAYARLTLFGSGAARLHDELVPVAAAWTEGAGGVQPYRDGTTANAAIQSIERLLASSAAAPSAVVCERIRARASQVFQALWPHLEAEADARAVDARQRLTRRGRTEADDLRKILKRQRAAIEKADARLKQGLLDFGATEEDEKRQVELDLRHLAARLGVLEKEIESEPLAIEALYDVKRVRIVPVGLAVAWPESMT